MTGLPCGEEIVTIDTLSRFETVLEHDGQTDGRTDGHRECLYQYRASELLC